MAIKVSLDYDSKRDIVDGFHDTGSVRVQKPASEALVFMVRGLCGKWKQLLCYFLSANCMSSSDLAELILTCIARLQNVAVDVKVVVCDQGANNRGMFTHFGISVQQPFIEIDGKKVFFMYDPPHLLKSVRNNFRRYPVQIKEGGIARWDYLKKFYDLDSRQQLRLAPKLKLSHVLLNGFKKMNVRLAAQALSHSVAVGISFHMNNAKDGFSPDAAATVDFILRMDKLFDSCNGISFKEFKFARRPVTEKSLRCKFWEETIEWLEHVKFLGAKARIYCIDGFILSLTVMRSLWLELKEQVKFLLPRCLNQDCLESFFSSIRQKGGFRDNPSACHFRSAMRQCVANKLLSAASGGNCELVTGDNLLLTMQMLGSRTDDASATKNDVAETISVSEPVTSSTPVQYVSYAATSLTAAERNALVYVAGYIVHRIQSLHACSCNNFLRKPGSLDDSDLAFIQLKAICAGDFGKLSVPSDGLVSYLDAVENRFVSVLPVLIHKRNCLASIAADIEQHVPQREIFANLCSGIYKKILMIYLRLRIHAELPRLLKKIVETKKSSSKRSRKLTKVKHE